MALFPFVVSDGELQRRVPGWAIRVGRRAEGEADVNE